jgi:hypothetical protein
MPAITSLSVVNKGLKKTLSSIIGDKAEYEDKAQFKKLFDEETENEAFVDDVEYGFTGLASETAEATEFPVGTLQQGIQTRYVMRKIGLKMIITREARKFNKYDKIIDAGKRLTRSIWKTMDIDGALIPARAENSAYVGGDGVSLANASHTLPGGGTFSNTMATPMAPSTLGISLAAIQAAKLPGHDGHREGYGLKMVVYPVDQMFAWSRLLNSSHAPEAGEFNAINVVKHDMDLKPLCLKQWTNSTTNWFAVTDAPDGLKWKWADKPYSTTWMENSQEVMFHQIASMYDKGWSDARCLIFSGA